MEYHDAYSESLEADFRELESALLSDTVKILAPNEPIKCSADTTVQAAILQMAEKRRAAVVIVNREGELQGIFTERDLLRRVAVPGRDPKTTPLSEVMTREPETLGPDALIAYAINRLHNAQLPDDPLDRRPGAADGHHDRERHRPVAGGALPGGDPQRAAGRRAEAPARRRRGLSARAAAPNTPPRRLRGRDVRRRAARDGAPGRYFTCSASHFAALACASDSPCLPAA